MRQRQGVRDLFASLLAEKGAEVSIDIDLPGVFGDPTQLQILLENLIENAIAYRDPIRKPRIVVSNLAPADPTKVSFSVTDNGLGIEDAHQSRIFEIFKRLHRADVVVGTELGLTLFRRVALNHGGDIQVTSEVGQGTTFTVSLPGRKA